MRSKIIIAVVTFIQQFAFSQIATNFTVQNCSGVNHNLFNSLDTGQIVVLTWVKPDNNGINYIENAYSVVNEFQVTFPNRVSMYICDDLGNTSCNGLSLWASGKTFSSCVSFSDSTIRMSDYKLNGLPKFAVIASTAHFVFDVQATTLNDSTFREAIHSALIGPIGQGGADPGPFGASVTPNPANSLITVKYRSEERSTSIIEILNASGKCVKAMEDSSVSGVNSHDIETATLAPGIYCLRLSNSEQVALVKFVILH